MQPRRPARASSLVFTVFAFAAVAVAAGCRRKSSAGGAAASAAASSSASASAAASAWADVPLPPRTSKGAHARFSTKDGVVDDWFSRLAWQRSASAPLDLRGAERFCAEQPGGFRLPSRLELLSLLDLDRAMPPLSDASFEGAEGAFWTSTPVAGADARRWSVSFTTGRTHPLAGSELARVRCVRGDVATAPNPRFRVAGDMVADEASRLLWTRAPLPSAASYLTASDACRKLVLGGVRGFRVPTRVELETLIDARRRAPAIDATTFVVGAHEIDWSGTAATSRGSEAWIVDMDSGETRATDVGEAHAIRCVKPI